jgi:hypothetical protein
MTSVVFHGRLMQLTTRLPKRRRGSRPTRPTRAAAQPAPTPETASASPNGSSPSARTRDARRGSGPEDRALYSCMCGYAFKAEVTTSVDCPHCGTLQAW